MKTLRAFALGALTALAMFADATGARAATITAGSGNGLAGQTVDIDISTTSLTGLNVTSLQFDLSYTNTICTAVSVVTTGTLTASAGWAAPVYSVTNTASTGRIRVNDLGTSPIVGAGSLLKVRFVLVPTLLGGGSTALTLSNVMLNEGTPSATPVAGTMTVTATPQFSLSPTTGEIVRGQTLQFSLTGSPTLPVTWSTTNGAIATISSTGLLTGVAPGSVSVSAIDAVGRSSTNAPVVAVRGVSVTVGSGSVVAGNTITVPLSVTSLAGLGVRSGQIELAYDRAALSLTSVTTPAGTLLNAWGHLTWGQKATGCLLNMLDTSDLGGSGVLCYLTFTTNTAKLGAAPVTFVSALFNETQPALGIAGTITVTSVPTLTVSPATVTLLAGQTQQYTVTGTTTPPLTWTVLDPSVASVSATGLVTALAGGVTQVRVRDAVGATGTSTSLTVYDLQITLGTVSAGPGSTVRIPIRTDRVVGSLGIRSLQFNIGWSGTGIVNGRTLNSGLWNVWGSGAVASKFNYGLGTLVCVGFGSAALPDGGTDLGAISLDVSPTATAGTDIPLTLSGLLFNEGSPRPLVVNGKLQVRASADVPLDPGADFALGRIEPNPSRAAARIEFTLPEAGSGVATRLCLFDVGGRKVRTLVDRVLGAGANAVTWDGRDDGGRVLRAGLYLVRLEHGGLAASRRLVRTD